MEPEEAVNDLSKLLTKALPLARYVNSDECSPQDRSRLRKLVNNEEGVFELSNLLNALCSERSRGSWK